MGADLIISVLAEPADKEFHLDWEAGVTRIESLDIGVMEAALDETGDLYDLEPNGDKYDEVEVRTAVRNLFKSLREDVIAPEGFPTRDVTTLKVRDLWLYVSGGMSWGDSPTDSSGIMDKASYFPEVLKAIGFVLDWDQEAAS